MTDLDDRITQLEAQMARLISQLDRQAEQAQAPSDGATTQPPTSRRQLLKLGGAATVGAVGAALVGSLPAGAAVGDPLSLGNDNDADGGVTEVKSTSNAITFRADNNMDGDAIYGMAFGSGSGVEAFSEHGYGVRCGGGLAPIQLEPMSSPGPPTSGFHNAGELLVDSNNALFSCMASGTPGAWARVGFNSLTPTRILDTRNGNGGITGPLTAGQTVNLTVGGAHGVPVQGSAVVMNATVTDTTSASFLTIFPEGTSRPTASNLNWSAGETIPNLVTVKLGNSSGISIFNDLGDVQVILDLAGFYS